LPLRHAASLLPLSPLIFAFIEPPLFSPPLQQLFGFSPAALHCAIFFAAIFGFHFSAYAAEFRY